MDKTTIPISDEETVEMDSVVSIPKQEASDQGNHEAKRGKGQENGDCSPSGEELEEPSNCLASACDSFEETVLGFLRPHKVNIIRLILLVVAAGYFVYFGFAMKHKFGDEGSIRLVWITSTVVVCLTMTFLLGFVTQETEDKLQHLLCTGRLPMILKWLMYLGITVFIIVYTVMTVLIDNPRNLFCVLGFVIFMLFCLIVSKKKTMINWRTVFWGIALQFIFAIVILRTVWGIMVFNWISLRLMEFLNNVQAGIFVVFGAKAYEHPFIFMSLPSLFFVSAVISILEHYGILPLVIRTFARLVALFLGTTPGETLAVTANCFLASVEAPLVVRPFLNTMTKSELFAVMVGGFSTVSGGALYIFSAYGVRANDLICASVMSVPAAMAVAKLVMPEFEQTKASSEDYYRMHSSKFRNVIEAAAHGASAGLPLFGNVAANILVFISLLGFVNNTVQWFSERIGMGDTITFEILLAYFFWPVSFLMGVAPQDCLRVGMLVGFRLFVGIIPAYEMLGNIMKNRPVFEEYVANYNDTGSWFYQGDHIVLTETNTTLINGVMDVRSEYIATYALCGFCDLMGAGIVLGIMQALAPKRMPEITRMIILALVTGNVGCFITAAVAGAVDAYGKIISRSIDIATGIGHLQKLGNQTVTKTGDVINTRLKEPHPMGHKRNWLL